MDHVVIPVHRNSNARLSKPDKELDEVTELVALRQKLCKAMGTARRVEPDKLLLAGQVTLHGSFFRLPGSDLLCCSEVHHGRYRFDICSANATYA